ncbi:MAG: integrase arm-type DNA-binding domain-containing protein [Micropepsaceae bacterium]
MKPKGHHRERALTPLRIKAIGAAGRYADGNGLYLVVDPSLAKRWVLRIVAVGRRMDIGLGGFKDVSLAEARERAARYRKLAKDGGDPIAEKRRERLVIPTFEEAARKVHGEHKPGWKNKKHADQWLSSLEQFVFPVFGNQRVDLVDTPEILKALSPVWLTKPETARRIRQRIGTVLDWAKASGFRTGDNPVAGVVKGLPKQAELRGHFAALPYNSVPQFVRDLQASSASETTKLAFELLILTAARTSEVLGATWGEFDLANKIWVIPASRMKGKREHRVPLSPRCVDVLGQLKVLAGNSEFICPGRNKKGSISNAIFLKAIRRLDLKITAHGFRSAFRNWAAEQTNYPREVCEMALAHANKDKTEAAYLRTDQFEKRRKLMNAWSTFVAAAKANVVHLPLRSA